MRLRGTFISMYSMTVFCSLVEAMDRVRATDAYFKLLAIDSDQQDVRWQMIVSQAFFGSFEASRREGL
jgi:hypothetical protein